MSDDKFDGTRETNSAGERIFGDAPAQPANDAGTLEHCFSSDSSMCPRCEGTGIYQRALCESKVCAVCNGTGKITPEIANELDRADSQPTSADARELAAKQLVEQWHGHFPGITMDVDSQETLEEMITLAFESYALSREQKRQRDWLMAQRPFLFIGQSPREDFEGLSQIYDNAVQAGEQSAWAQAIEQALEIIDEVIGDWGTLDHPFRTKHKEICQKLKALHRDPNWLAEHDKEVAAKARLEEHRITCSYCCLKDRKGWCNHGLELEREAGAGKS
jgi:hypothetical protein